MNKTVRDSNMELYRIVCMFLVMLFHVCGVVDVTNNEVLPSCPPSRMLLTQLATSATFVCVDVFILLSGWYGIRTRTEKVAAFVYQVLFLSILSYIVFIACYDDVTFSWSFLAHVFLMDDYWFVSTYLLLYLVAPMLNSFIRDSSHRQFRFILIAAILFQCVYGWLSPREAGFLEGRSPFSFLLLYMLAGYVRRFPVRLKQLPKNRLLTLYLLTVAVNGLLAFAARYTGHVQLVNIIYRFSSPLIIFASLCLLLYFSKLSISHQPLINRVAASSFAAFLVHCFPMFTLKVFWPVVQKMYLSLPAAVFAVAALLFVVLVYVASILIDQVRIATYGLLRRLFVKQLPVK